MAEGSCSDLFIAVDVDLRFIAPEPEGFISSFVQLNKLEFDLANWLEFNYRTEASRRAVGVARKQNELVEGGARGFERENRIEICLHQFILCLLWFADDGGIALITESNDLQKMFF